MRRLLLICTAGVLSVLLIASMVLAENGTRIPPQQRMEPDAALAAQVPHHHESVHVQTPDGLILKAWYFRPASWNRSSVILLHGVADTRSGVLGHAAFLLRNGYSTLLPDARGHGTSGGDSITYGLKERHNVKLWTDWLVQQAHSERIYGLGESMGAAILIQSTLVEPRIRAVVAECSFATFRGVAYYRVAQLMGLHRRAQWMFAPLIEPAFLYSRAKYDVNLGDASPVDALRQSTTPVLLIHGTADTNIPAAHSDMLARARPANTDLWLVPTAIHTQAHAAQPAEYERRVVEWFRRH
jgi:fermentation-respiration switch protein FrsA (DUF1100 family)